MLRTWITRLAQTRPRRRHPAMRLEALEGRDVPTSVVPDPPAAADPPARPADPPMTAMSADDLYRLMLALGYPPAWLQDITGSVAPPPPAPSIPTAPVLAEDGTPPTQPTQPTQPTPDRPTGTSQPPPNRQGDQPQPPATRPAGVDRLPTAERAAPTLPTFPAAAPVTHGTPVDRPAPTPGTTAPTRGVTSEAACGSARAGSAAVEPPQNRPAGPTTDAPDATLLRRFACGEQSAFTELVRRHGPTVRAVCVRVLGDSDRAGDAAQATFMALARRSTALDARNGLSGWLYRVAGRMAVRCRVADSRRRQVERAAARPNDTADAVSLIDAGDTARAVREELGRLPDKYRVPLELCYINGRTHAEVAAETGLPRGSVAKRIGEGLDRLREGLAVRGVWH